MPHYFFDKLRQLRNQTPYLPSNLRIFKGFENVNCVYCDEMTTSADCHVCFTCCELSRSAYCGYLFVSNECLDCDNGTEMQLCYGCIDDCQKCHSCTFCSGCQNCMRSHFCDTCFNLTDCFGCVEIENEKFRIFNKQYSENEYRKIVERLRKEPPKKIMEKVWQLRKMLPKENVREFENTACVLCSYSFFNTRCYEIFYSRRNEDCAHMFEGVECKDTVDATLTFQSQSVYEAVNSDSISHSAFMIDCSRTHFSYFCNYCSDCRYCFGCIGLEYKEYHIFNKPYTPEEYHHHVKQILEDLNKKKVVVSAEFAQVFKLDMENQAPTKKRKKA